MVSQFYFIRKFLTRTLEAWRQGVKADTMARAIEDNHSKTKLEECFLALKKNYYGSLMLKNLKISKQLLLCRSIMQRWANYAFLMRRNKDIVSYFSNRIELRLKTKAF